jgi:hypothetical protein
MVDNRKFSPLFVEEFIQEMNQFYGVSLDKDFKKYTYGTENFSNLKSNHGSTVHKKLSLKELQKLL